MNCRIARRNIEMEALGALSDIERSQLEEHAADCEDCRSQRIATLVLARRVAASCSMAQVDDATIARLRAAVQAEVATAPRRRGVMRPAYGVWATAAGLVLFVGAAVALRTSLFGTSTQAAVAESWHIDGMRVAAMSPAYMPAVAGTTAYALRNTGHGDMVAAVDTRTGREQWVSSVPSRGHIATDQHGVYTVSADQADGGAVVALDPSSGATRWRHIPQGHGQATAGLLAAGGRVLWARGGSLLALDSRSGERAWEYGGESGGAVSRPLAMLDRVLVVAGGKLECLSVGDGSVVWSCMVDSAPSFLALPQLGFADNHIYVAHRSSDLEGHVSCVDAATGVPVWERTGIDAAHVAACGPMVYVRGESIVALDASTGQTVWQAAARGCSPLFCAQGYVVYADAAKAQAFTVLDAATGAMVAQVALPNACTGLVMAGDVGLVNTNDGVMRAVPTRTLLRGSAL